MELSGSEEQSQMKAYTESLENKWNIELAGLLPELERAQVPHGNVFSLEEEQEEFLEEFNRVINNKDIKEADELFLQDTYLNIELGIQRIRYC